MDAASTRLLVNVAALVAREIEGMAGQQLDLPPLQPKVSLCRGFVGSLLGVCGLAVGGLWDHCWGFVGSLSGVCGVAVGGLWARCRGFVGSQFGKGTKKESKFYRGGEVAGGS